MSTILALDTSGPVAGVALMQSGEIAYEAMRNCGLTHSQTAMGMVEQALECLNLEPTDVDLYAAVVGPGSFTGVRIGVCAARAMAHAAGRPAVGVNALHALATGADGVDGLICPVLDARRGQVYCAAFRWAGGPLPERALPDAAMALDDFLAALPPGEAPYFLGDGLRAHEGAIRSALGDRARLAPPHGRYLRPAAACYAAMHQPPGAPGELLPLYLRLPQAERERAGREVGRG